MIKSIVALAAIIAAPNAAHASCEPRFVERSVTVNVSPDLFGTNLSASENLSVRTRNDGTSNQCSATMMIARLSTSPFMGQLAYSFSKGNTDIRVQPSESIVGSLADGLFIQQLPGDDNGRNVPFKIVVPTEWGIPTGTFVDELQLQLVDPLGNVTDRVPLRVIFSIPSAIELRIVGATGYHAIAGIDLGTLSTARVSDSSPFGLRVWSTAPYSISFQSENGGRLLHKERLGEIDYELLLRGSEIGTNGEIAATVARATSSTGDLHPLLVRVQPFRSYAGDYADRVLVTVTAN